MTDRRKRNHANVEEHPKGSGLYRVRARIGKRLVTVASKLSAKVAHETADTYGLLRDEGELRQGLTLDQFGAGFLDRREKRGLRGVRKDRNRWKNYVTNDPLGGIAIGALRRSDIVEWRDRLVAKALAGQTIRNALNLVRSALSEALDRELVDDNVALTVKLPRGWGATTEEDLSGILLPAEQQALLAAVPEEHVSLVLVALLVGVRWSELSHLRREDVLEDSVIIRRSTGGGPTKRGKPRRMPLLGPARQAIEQRLQSVPRRCPWVFASDKTGTPRVTRPSAWKRWVREAGIDRRIRWHDLRHTCATSLLAGWWDSDGKRWAIDEVCRMLGHSSTQVTERYAKKLDETLFAAAARMKFPGGNGSKGSPGKHSLSNAFLNRWSDVRIVSGAPQQSSQIRNRSALALGTSREHSDLAFPSRKSVGPDLAARAADAALGTYLRELADGIAEGVCG